MKYSIKEKKLNEAIKGFLSPCCNAKVKYTSTSGVYVCPGLYCSNCKKLL